jgi:type II secretory pathway pseudopilin PulG
MNYKLSRHQKGTSLFVGLIMLILLTLLAISAFQSSNTNLKIVGNMQVRQESLSAAQTATEQVISDPAFINPTTPPASRTVTLNKAPYTVQFTPAPACVSVVDIPSEDLDPTNADDLKCIPSGVTRESGIFSSGAPLPPSYCSNTRWLVTARVQDPNTSGDTTLQQGVAVRVSKAKALTYCP